MKFEDLGLSEPLLRALQSEQYHAATKIQAAAIGPILEGRHVLGCAQTGTGKTAAYALPMLERLTQSRSTQPRASGKAGPRRIRAIVLSPTRELALQICESFRTYGQHTGLRQVAVYGGVSQGNQVRALRSGVDILVATPGRLLDLMNQGFIDLAHVEILVLDESDRMLDMGFLPDLERIIAKTPATRQTLMFSATMPGPIRTLASRWLTDPVDIHVSPIASTADRVQQSVFFVDKTHKLGLLMHWLEKTAWTRVLVFTRTKHGADKVSRHLLKAGIPSDALHGNKSQSARQRALARFKLPKPLVLVATDIAARGLDVDLISHVVNFDLPVDAESYVHRVGRTARAEAPGVAVSFCDHDERSMLKSIERLTRQNLAVDPTPKEMASVKRHSDGGGNRSGRPAASRSGDSQENRGADKRAESRRRRTPDAANHQAVVAGGGGPRRQRKRYAASQAARGSNGGPAATRHVR